MGRLFPAKSQVSMNSNGNLIWSKQMQVFARDSDCSDLCGSRDSWRNSSNAFSTDQLSRHQKLLRRETRLLNAPKGEFRKVRPQFLWKFAHRRQRGMQHVTESIVEAGNAYIVGDSNTGFLQSLINAGRDLIRAYKKCRRPISAGQQRLDGQITKFPIFGMKFTVARLQSRFLHSLLVSLSTPGKPGQPEIADVPNIRVAPADEMPSDFRRAPYVVGINAIAFLGAPVANDIVSHNRKGNALLAERIENAHRMCAAQNHACGPIRPGQSLRQPYVGGRCIQIKTKGDELKVPTVLSTIALGAEEDL